MPGVEYLHIGYNKQGYTLKEGRLVKDKHIAILFLLLTTGYVAVALFGPIDPATLSKYSLTLGGARLLTLSIVVPIVAIWMSALYGLLRFREYAKVVEDTKEGKAFKYIALGITLLAFSLPVAGMVSSTLGAIAVRNPGFLVGSIIIKNYINLILPACGLLLLNKGSNELLSTLKRNKAPAWPPFSLPAVIVLSSFYTWCITTRAFGFTGDAGYYLPNWLILATLAVPYLYVWCRGLLSAYRLFVYRRNIRGQVYKNSLTALARGVTTIIVLSILTQLITTISARLSRLNLTPILLIIYVLVALNAVGYGLLAYGAKKLKQIEEV